jgi:superfamily II DNA/RNA helicase
VPRHQFIDFPISDELQANIVARGYIAPTPIQDQTIPLLLQGRDVVGIANTGTGKTAAFLIPLIDKVMKNPKLKVLIVTPTRELAVQIEDEFWAFAQNTNLSSVLCIGGLTISKQISGLRKNPQFVIGTPGRLKDLTDRHALYYEDYSSIVLDEVDRMLDMGFVNDIRQMIHELPPVRHSLFFSATVPEKVKSIMNQFLHDPITVSVTTHQTSDNVDQDVIRTNGKPKIEVLHDLLIQDSFKKVLVFGRTKWSMEKLSKELQIRGFRTASIHGNKTQYQRQKALEMFKNNHIQVLIATDLASRGLDIDNVTHVINYDLPESYEDYIHRIGRTGRADKTGVALTFID